MPTSGTAFQSREWIEYRQSNQITSTSLIDFNITPQPSAYIALKRNVLNEKLSLVNGDGSPIKEALAVGLIDLPLHTIQRSGCDLSAAPLSHIGKKAYLNTILKTNQCNEKNILTSQLFYKDSGPDSSDVKTSRNAEPFN